MFNPLLESFLTVRRFNSCSKVVWLFFIRTLFSLGVLVSLLYPTSNLPPAPQVMVPGWLVSCRLVDNNKNWSAGCKKAGCCLLYSIIRLSNPFSKPSFLRRS